MKIGVVHPVLPKLPVPIFIVNIESYELRPFTLLARKRHDHHRLLAWLIVKVEVKRELFRGHHHEHEIVGSCTVPHSQHFEHIPCRHGESHHLRESSPTGSCALQFQKPAHDVVPHFVNPQWSFFLPVFGIVFWRIKKTNPVRFGIDDFYLDQFPTSVEYFFKHCVPFGGDSQTPQLPANALLGLAVASSHFANSSFVML